MKSAAPKFKGTMLMMNQGAAAAAAAAATAAAARPAAGAPPAASAPPSPSFGGDVGAPSSNVGSGAPKAGAAPGLPSRLKGTIVGVAAPAMGAAPAPPAPIPGTLAFEAPPNFGGPPVGADPIAAPPDQPPHHQHQVGSAQGLNPLGATIAHDQPSPMLGMDPSSFGSGAGGPPPGAGGVGAPGGYGSPPGDPFGAPPPMDGGAMGGGMGPGGGGYGAPPQQQAYGSPPPGQDFGAPPAGGYGVMNQGMPGSGGMQPYSGGPMAPAGLPGAMTAGGEKSWLTTLLLAFFLGYLGVHRFYTGHTLLGVLQLVTCGGFGIWTWVDIILILMNKYTDAQGRPLVKQ